MDAQKTYGQVKRFRGLIALIFLASITAAAVLYGPDAVELLILPVMLIFIVSAFDGIEGCGCASWIMVLVILCVWVIVIIKK